jgi:uncharacterized protein (TIGR00369 family)
MSTSPAFEPKTADFEARCRDSFSRQPFMAHLGAKLVAVRPGFVEIRMAHRPELRQQHGYFHGGSIASALDSAAGYAAFSLMPADSTILTVEYKLNFVNPGEGAELIARGQVIKPGRTLTIVQADAFVPHQGGERIVATSIQTLMAIPRKADAPGMKPVHAARS